MKNKLINYLANSNAIERSKFLEGDCFYIRITEKCNSHCRHCSSREYLNVNIDAEEQLVLNWIDQIKDTSIKLIYFIGGEPFLAKDKLMNYINKADEAGIFCGVVTNGSWAKTVERGIEILKGMEGLNLLVISSDKYHLEYIDAQLVKNAIKAGLATNKFIAMNITYVDKKEVEEVLELYKDYKRVIKIGSSKALPLGGATNMPIEREPLFQQIERIPVSCGLGKYMINIFGEVNACCQSHRTPDPYLALGKLTEESLSTIFQRIPNHCVYQFIFKEGPRGIAKIFMKSPYKEQLKNQLFTGPCEFCLKLLGNKETLDYFLKEVGTADASSV